MGATGGFRIAKILGIPIMLDVTFFVSLGLITVILATQALPSLIRPDPPDAVLAGLAVITALAFFLSLLLHELAHSLVARLYGFKVARITLFLLGGVSQIAQESQRASQEFLIAFAGPATSAVLGLAFTGAYVVLDAPDTQAAAVLRILGDGNIVLAVFNMLPGFPMDGGRVVRSAVWAVTRSRWRATVIAATLGQAFGALLSLFGLITFLEINVGLETGAFGGLWLVIIGAFLFNAAAQSKRSARAEEQLSGIRVRDVMATDLRTIPAQTRVASLAPSRERVDPRAVYPITDAETVVGIVTGAALLVLDEQRYRTATVGEVMVRADALTPIAPGATGQEALDRLQEAGQLVLPVVENGRLLGLIGLEHLAQALQRRRAAPGVGTP